MAAACFYLPNSVQGLLWLTLTKNYVEKEIMENYLTIQDHLNKILMIPSQLMEA